MNNEKDINDNLARQVEEFKKIAQYSVDPCHIATAIALSDKEVINVITRKLSEGNIFNGYRCLERVTSWEIIYVYFDFKCKPDVPCFVKPAFVAVVNMITRKVEEIIDPYIESNINKLKGILDQENKCFPVKELLGERTYLVLANHTGRDLHVEVRCDVHTGFWGDQINSNKEPEIKSKKVPFDEYAKYCFKIWKNDNGHKGEYVGDFEHSVTFDILGNRDTLLFTIININGVDYLQAYSVKKIVKIALLIWSAS